MNDIGMCRQRVPVRLRCLPDGEFRDGFQVGRQGQFLELELTDEEFSPGVAVEIQCGSMLYLAELQKRNGAHATAHIEHVADRVGLASIQEGWQPK